MQLAEEMEDAKSELMRFRTSTRGASMVSTAPWEVKGGKELRLTDDDLDVSFSSLSLSFKNLSPLELKPVSCSKGKLEGFVVSSEVVVDL